MDELADRCNTIEETYEFMLAYAAQGLPGDPSNKTASQLTEFLRRSDAALSGLADLFRTIVRREAIEPADKYDAFIDVLERDARAAQAALQLAMVQPAISSQLIDNLNASIHLRALLTDLFLIDEIVKAHAAARHRAS
jgi:hypothetical protein